MPICVHRPRASRPLPPLLGKFNNWSSDGPLAAAPSADLARAAKNIFLSFFQHFTDSQWAILAKARAARDFFWVFTPQMHENMIFWRFGVFGAFAPPKPSAPSAPPARGSAGDCNH